MMESTECRASLSTRAIEVVRYVCNIVCCQNDKGADEHHRKKPTPHAGEVAIISINSFRQRPGNAPRFKVAPNAAAYF
jgi:hypothetical protein